jgi:hypothetical protein
VIGYLSNTIRGFPRTAIAQVRNCGEAQNEAPHVSSTVTLFDSNHRLASRTRWISAVGLALPVFGQLNIFRKADDSIRSAFLHLSHVKEVSAIE